MLLPRELLFSLDLRIGGLGGGRFVAGEGAGGGRRLVTCLTSEFPLVGARAMLDDGLEESIEDKLELLFTDSLIGL